MILEMRKMGQEKLSTHTRLNIIKQLPGDLRLCDWVGHLQCHLGLEMWVLSKCCDLSFYVIVKKNKVFVHLC